MIYAIYGFFFGFCIPYIARRFSKFMPATFAYGLYRIFTPGKKACKMRRKNNLQYMRLMNRYIMRSFGWGVFTAATSYLIYTATGGISVVWWLFFIWSLLLLAEIDERMFLLPDILTIPLLLIGFLFACVSFSMVSPQESAIGASVGYFLPTAVSLLFVWKNKDAFGGGDIKLLSAIGAWLGIQSLIYVIILSAVIFAFYALLKKQRTAAYGPAVALASIIVALYFF